MSASATRERETVKLTTDLIPDGSDALMGAFLARDYYGGMMSALYAVASSGSLELRAGDGLYPLIRELSEAVDIAAAHYPEDYDSLLAFLAWARDLQDQINSEATE